MERLTVVERAINQELHRLTVSTLGQFYGCCGLLDMCGDRDLMSLSLAGSEPFLDALGWTPSDVCRIRKSFIPWIRPAKDIEGQYTAGYLSDACADPSGVDFSVCDFQIEDFGRLRRHSPVRDITKTGLRLCETQPRYRLDGSQISDDMEFGMRLATEAILQDLKRYIITGNSATPGLFSGLQTLIDSTYYDPAGVRCEIMDSIVVDWNSNPFSGGAGITWNGVAVAATFDMIDVLLAIYRRIKQRLALAPSLAGGLRVGDMVLVMPTNLIQCLLDAFTCWSVCPGAQYNEANLNTFEARRFRDTLNGGPFGAGHITFDGFDIPLIAYDWNTQHGTNRGDMYFLTLRAGNMRLVEGQYNNMANVPNVAGVPAGSFVPTDGGRFLTWAQSDHTCVEQVVEMQPRILMWAPWAQARIMDVRCAGVVGPISPDPTEASYFIEGASVTAAACPA